MTTAKEKWTLHFREDDNAVIYCKLDDYQRGASKEWRSGVVLAEDRKTLEEMLATAYELGKARARAEIRNALGI